MTMGFDLMMVVLKQTIEQVEQVRNKVKIEINDFRNVFLAFFNVAKGKRPKVGIR